MGDSLRNFTSSICFFMSAIGNFVFLFTNYFITDYKTDIILASIVILIMLLFISWIRETPFYYYKKRKLKELLVTLNEGSTKNNTWLK